MELPGNLLQKLERELHKSRIDVETSWDCASSSYYPTLPKLFSVPLTSKQSSCLHTVHLFLQHECVLPVYSLTNDLMPVTAALCLGKISCPSPWVKFKETGSQRKRFAFVIFHSPCSPVSVITHLSPSHCRQCHFHRPRCG